MQEFIAVCYSATNPTPDGLEEKIALSKWGTFTIPILTTIGVASAVGFARSRNARLVRRAFKRWSDGNGSLFDLMTDDALISIPGTSAHCGTFSRSAFEKDVATPFVARFYEPPRPRAVKAWADGDDIAVLAEATGTTSDGKPYANSYVFVLKMRGARISHATEFLDMAAFNAVWDRVEPKPSVAVANP